MNRPPHLGDDLRPRTVAGETLWVSGNGAWAVVPRRLMERHLGLSLDDPEDSAAIDLGLVLGTDRAIEADVPPSAEVAASPPVVPDAVVVVPPPDPPTGPPWGGEVAGGVPSPDAGEASPASSVPAASTPPAVPADEPGPPAPVTPDVGDLRATVRGQWVPPEEEQERDRRLWRGSLAVLGLSAVLLVTAGVVALRSPAPPQPAPAAPAPDASAAPPPAAAAAHPGVASSFSEAASLRARQDVERRADAPGGGAVSAVGAASVGLPAWQVHIDEGWRTVAIDPAAAAERFRQAIALYPRHGDAFHGLGVALLAQDDPRGAEWLCQARRLDLSLAPRIEALLAERGLGCDAR